MVMMWAYGAKSKTSPPFTGSCLRPALGDALDNRYMYMYMYMYFQGGKLPSCSERLLQ